MDDVTILKASSRSTRHLMTLEALFINHSRSAEVLNKYQQIVQCRMYSDICYR